MSIDILYIHLQYANLHHITKNTQFLSNIVQI